MRAGDGREIWRLAPGGLTSLDGRCLTASSTGSRLSPCDAVSSQADVDGVAYCSEEVELESRRKRKGI